MISVSVSEEESSVYLNIFLHVPLIQNKFFLYPNRKTENENYMLDNFEACISYVYVIFVHETM